MEISLGGESVEIKPCTLSAGLQAVGILARHLKEIEPALSFLVESTGKSDVDWTHVGLSVLQKLEPLFTQGGDDVILFLSLTSGLDRGRIANAALVESWELFRAIAASNNLTGMLSLAKNAQR